ncbi:soluble lytic murein transglycosylase [Vibrio mimicus]|uniref:transglycosylase SLT domain-containing protein n=1 Tax=Vibrio mimicus TaxID=674 RepID=UPI0002BA3D4F|nr:transglycosylase SLT domain-containing protein [Vibrio mimicus]EMB51161.1 soluble lytic murein transglycosylase [Vibrio mimicus CAIM 602]MBY7676295.1 transglycosylase SLT domain-containing protein [Vibrio mimicus]MBY7728155.1 transglycosylase SLT domain-containing protein [Vibrio mimicus]TXY32547.1 transglycosylase SLT domain-containing protein [Vibrio mimicus]SUP13943.1 soluble lytic murein transglycosylase [Vibrio mimicus]
MTRLTVFKPHSLVSILMLTTVCAMGSARASALDLEAQRAQYEQAQRWLDEKKVPEYQRIRKQIESYPLTPYLDYRAFLVDLGSKPPIAVRNFIDSHKEYPFSGRVAAPYLDALAQNKKWAALLQFQTQLPNGETYQCHYFNAKLQTGKRSEAFEGAKKLWLNGASIADACDPLFAEWERVGGLTDEWVLKRSLLAFEGRNRNLMIYLQKKLDGKKSQAKAQAMLELFDKPERVVAYSRKASQDPINQKVAELALQKWARSEPQEAQAVLNDVAKAQGWNREQKSRISHFIAIRLMETEDEALAKWRDEVARQSNNVRLIEARTRLALRENNWRELTQWISVLPEQERKTLRWQYWLGRSEMALGKKKEGTERLKTLLGQRSFYSVAAAKVLQQSVNYPTSTVTLDMALIKAHKKALVRIDELIALDKVIAAKSEWRWLLERVSQKEKEMLAAYAANAGWHQMTITATISASLWDNNQLRFPVVHQNLFNLHGQKNGIDPITLMSLARQESAMDSDAQSPVGARGLMQIMPDTARYTARKYQLSYSNPDELYQVGKNIEIGSRYLSSLLERYDQNRILAFAAYNAGPSRVDTWLKRSQGKLDAYGFIEAIPFAETRGYVQNILMFETYYRDLMGVEGRFLNDHELNTKY